MAGFDMNVLDSYPSGCISVWLQQHGVLDDWRRNILAEYEQRLLRVIPELDDYGRSMSGRAIPLGTATPQRAPILIGR